MAVRKFGFFDFRNYIPLEMKALNDGSISVGKASSDTTVSAWHTPAGPLALAQLGACGVAPGLAPVLTTNGWNLPYAATNALGCELCPLNVATTSAANSCNFVLGTDPSFFVQATFQIATVANDLIVGVGFRTAGAFNGTTANYTTLANWLTTTTLYNDVIFLGDEAGTLHSVYHSNSASNGADTSTTQTTTNATNVTLKVIVNSAGTQASFYVNGSAASFGATGTLAGTHTVVPFFVGLQGAGAQTLINIQSLMWGYV